MRRIVGLALVIALSIFAAFVVTFRNNLWISYRGYNSPYLADLPLGSVRAAPSQRVVLVLVRGLRLDEAREMPNLSALRDSGSALTVQHEPPTFRLPSWATLTSGASAEIHGITTNNSPRATRYSSLIQVAQSAGQKVSAVGSQSLADMLDGDVQRFEVVDNSDVSQRDDDAVRLAMEVMKDTTNPPSLVLVELTAIEDTIRGEPSDISAAVTLTDGRIKTLLSNIDLHTSTIVILADRGLSNRNTDGGDESDIAVTPMIMAGAGVHPGIALLIQSTDVAPTIAALLGAPLPAQVQGQPIVAALSLPSTGAGIGATPQTTAVTATESATANLAPLPALLWSSALQLTTFYENWSEVIQQPRFASELLRAGETDIKNGNIQAYQGFYNNLTARADGLRTAKLNAERAQRLPVAIGAVLLLIAISGVVLSSRRWQPFIGAALYAIAWYAIFTYLRGFRFSLSMFSNSDPTQFIAAVARDSEILTAAVSILVAVTTGKHEDGLEAVTTAMNTLLLIVGIQLAQAVWFYFQWGNNFTWALPDSSQLVATLVALTQISALSIRVVPELPNLPMPLVIAFLALLIHSLVRQREQPERYRRLR
ncbi:MAG: alkaline phosphatase family protein [Chloroflexi bacterium]|nr:alkaline phosphatase family protein [Chloroflexota bacterium]MCL5274786.1 alkaline phosphatase family protein [Chloroflexota bacterium]